MNYLNLKEELDSLTERGGVIEEEIASLGPKQIDGKLHEVPNKNIYGKIVDYTKEEVLIRGIRITDAGVLDYVDYWTKSKSSELPLVNESSLKNRIGELIIGYLNNVHSN